MYQKAPFRYDNAFYTVKGKGRAVVLLHGFMGSSEVWQEFANDLSKRYKVVCIDLPGHGQTPSYGYIHNMELMAACVDAVLKKLRLRRVALVGHSMGGYVSLA